MIKTYRKQSGFSLLELLVVIGIIGILVGIGTISYTSAQTRARDSRRRGDIEAVGKALEQYYAQNNGTYPLDDSCAGYEGFLAGGAPTDPKTGSSYITAGDCAAAGDSFCICAEMEIEATGNAYVKSGPQTTCTWSGGVSKDYYCAQNQQ
jgi:prepilin-type N-terminal cleavage/methylation domain-containing protein